MANFVPIGTLITRCRQRWNGEGDTRGVSDWEICDNLNVSLATEVYDLCRSAVSENYYRKQYPITVLSGTQVYDLPSDFLSDISVDVFLNSTAGAPPSTQQQRISARRATESERNAYAYGIVLGWYPGATVMYSIEGQLIRFLSTPLNVTQTSMNYVPVAPKLGGGALPGSYPLVPCNYTDLWDDINGWSEIAVLDSARKCAFKKNRLDLAAALSSEKDRLKAQVKALLPLRNAGEPLRPNIYNRREWGDGYFD
jgi:hypothetical protein